MSLRFFSDDIVALSNSRSFLKNTKWFLLNHSLHMLFLIRLGQDLHRIPIVGKLLAFFIEYGVRVLYASDISCQAKIGKGFIISHGHDIVIGADVIIGERCKVYNGVTLGNKDIIAFSTGNQPKVGNDVVISTGAKVLGPINVGNGVVIGANSVVIRDCPEYTVIAGIPGRVVKAINAKN